MHRWFRVSCLPVSIWALLQIITLSASTNKLSLTHEEAEDYAALVMKLLDTENRSYIEVHTFNRGNRFSLEIKLCSRTFCCPSNVCQ